MYTVEKILLFHLAALTLIVVLVIVIKGWKSTKQYIKLLFSKRVIPKCVPPKRESTADGYESRPVREPEYWTRVVLVAELQEVRMNIIKELMEMNNTDWSNYALRFICNHSPKLTHLMVNGEVNLELIQNEEMQGIKDTIDIVQGVVIREPTSLRNYFREIFRATAQHFLYDANRKFYFYGRDRVLNMLRMYKASEGTFPNYQATASEPSGLELTGDTSIDNKMVQKIRKAIDYYEKTGTRSAYIDEIKEYFRYPLSVPWPYIEFDLDQIEKIENFKSQGSLVNSLFWELKRLLQVGLGNDATDYYADGDVLWDQYRIYFPIDDGCVCLIKVKGSVDYYPDRLYVYFFDLTKEHWTYKWLKSYQLFLEGND